MAAHANLAFFATHSLGIATGQYHCVRSATARNGFGLDLHPQTRIDQASHLDQCSSRADSSEHLTVHLAKRLGIGNVSNEHPRAHNILETRTSLVQRFLDNAENALCLGPDIALSDHPAPSIHCSCSGDKNLCSRSNGSTVANLALPLGPGTYELTAHGLNSACTR